MSETPTIIAFERRTRPGRAASLVFGIPAGEPVEGWFAEVSIAGLREHYSQLDGETTWIADALYAKNGVPVFVHGFGSRATIPRYANGAVHDLLNAARDKAISEREKA